MKKLLINTKISLLLFLLVIGQALQAAPVGFVRSLKGNAFSLWNGKMKVLNSGDTIEDFTDIYTEEGSEIVLADYRDHSLHLAGSGHVKMIRGMIELQKGYLWIKSVGSKANSESLFILTANAQVQFRNGEGVISYDYSLEKTQVLSVLGSMSIENSKVNYLREEIPEGHFSFVSKKYNEGAPRIATPIGEESFKKIVSLFEISTEDKKAGESKRMIASVPADSQKASAETFDVPAPQTKKGEGPGKIKIMRTQTHQYKDLKTDYMSALKKEKSRRIAAKKPLEPLPKTGVKMMMYGFDQKVATTAKPKVEPASPVAKPLVNMERAEKTLKLENKPIDVTNVTKEAVVERVPASQVDSTFEDSLNSQYKKQPKHKSDLSKLINELQNFDQDYSSQD